MHKTTTLFLRTLSRIAIVFIMQFFVSSDVHSEAGTFNVSITPGVVYKGCQTVYTVTITTVSAASNKELGSFIFSLPNDLGTPSALSSITSGSGKSWSGSISGQNIRLNANNASSAVLKSNNETLQFTFTATSSASASTHNWTSIIGYEPVNFSGSTNTPSNGQPSTIIRDSAPTGFSYPSISPISYGTSGSVTPSALTSQEATVSYSISPSNVAGVTINASTGVISYSNLVTAGTYLFTVTVSNCVGSATADFSLEIQKVQLTVTPANVTRVYGSANPTFTATITGFVNSQTSSVLTGSPGLTTLALPSSPIGTYSITASIGSLSSSNYSFSFGSGTLTVTKKPLTISTSAQNKVYDGTTLATLNTPSISGVVSGDDVVLSSYTAAFSTAAVGNAKPVTVSTFTISGAAASNYDLSQPTGLQANITPAPLTISADTYFRPWKTSVPSSTQYSTGFSVSGLVNEETVPSVYLQYPSGTNSGAGNNDPVGLYPNAIIPSAAQSAGTFSASNYSITYVRGDIVIGNLFYSVSNGNWNSAATWSSTSGGSAGTSVPDQHDFVFIERGNTVTVTSNASCVNLTFDANGGLGGTLQVDPGVTLDVSQVVALHLDPALNTTGNINGSGTLRAKSMQIGSSGSSSPNAASTSNQLNLRVSRLELQNDFTINNADNGTSKANIEKVNIFSPCAFFLRNIIINQNITGLSSTVEIYAETGSTVNLFGGANPISIRSVQSLLTDKVKFILNSSTFNFNSSTTPQTIPFTLSNSGSGGTTNPINVNYGHLTINNTHGSGATLGAAITGTRVIENITVGDINQGSLLNTGNFNVTMANGKSLNVSAGSTLNAGTSIIQLGTSAAGGTAHIEGTFQTANSSGFSGSAATAIKSMYSPSINLGSASMVEYNAVGNQTVTPFSGGYKGLKISGGGLKTLSASTTVSRELVLNRGYLIASATNILSLTKGAISTGASVLSFVDGELRKIGDLDRPEGFLYPSGSFNNGAPVYRPIKLSDLKNPKNGVDEEYFTVHFHPMFWVNKEHPNPNKNYKIKPVNRSTKTRTIKNLNTTEFWDIDRMEGSSAMVTLTHTWNSNPVPNLSVQSPLRIGLGHYKYVENDESQIGWEDATETDRPAGSPIARRFVGGDLNNGYIIVTNVSDFSPVAFGELDDDAFTSAAMPVTLIDFRARITPDNKVALGWATASESLNKGFRIQRQTASNGMGGKFEQIGFVGSKAHGGNSQSSLYYNFMDQMPIKGTSFYRLVQEDLDGTLTNSEVRLINLSESQSVVLLYPNPSNGSFTVSRTPNGKKISIVIYDLAGKIVKQVFNIAEPIYRMDLEQPGMYTVKLTCAETGEQSIQRIVIQK